MKDRPRIQLRLTLSDKIIETIGWALLCITWILVILFYNRLSDIIPIHYNAAGVADGFGGKIHLIILSILSSALFIGMTILNKFPHIFNYPVKITEDNAFAQYQNMARMIRIVKLVVVLIFGLIVFKTISIAGNQGNEIGSWVFILTIVLVFVPITFYIVKSFLYR